MTTTLNKRFIFNLIRKPPAPGYEADLLYTQCSLMPGFLSEKPRFSREGVWTWDYSQCCKHWCVFTVLRCFTVHNV